MIKALPYKELASEESERCQMLRAFNQVDMSVKTDLNFYAT